MRCPLRARARAGAGTPLGSLVQFGGYFPQVFGQSPDPTTRTRPAGDLGPRYRIVYRVPGPSGASTIVQDVYPYAKPSPVTHMRGGQLFWGGQRTYGGWLVAGAGLKTALVEAGLPKLAPSSSGESFPWTWTGAGAPNGHGWSRYGPGPPIRFRALGLGTLDWPLIVSTLIDEGFESILYIEHEDALLPRRQSIMRSRDLLREFLPGEAAEGRTW